VKDGIEYVDLVIHKRSNEYIKSICEGLGYTDEQVKHILSNAEGIRVYGQMVRRRNLKDRYDRIKELNKKRRDNIIHPNELNELKELVNPKSKDDNDENESRKSDLWLVGEINNNNISLLLRKDQIFGKKKERKNTTYYVDETNYVMTKEEVIKFYIGKEYNISKQIKPYNIKKNTQTELLRSDGKYKLSSDVNLEVMVTRMHKKSINVGNQAKPQKNKIIYKK
jgi:hypothetical protein